MTLDNSAGSKKKRHSQWVSSDESPFELPRSIITAIRKCASSHEIESHHDEELAKYLWINMEVRPHSGNPSHVTQALSLEDWLNVVDEAASLGVCCIVIGVGSSLHQLPYLWEICRWAQMTHAVNVGIHACNPDLSDKTLDALNTLDKEKTWLFINRKNTETMQKLQAQGFRVCAAEVCREDHEPPCDMSEDMVFVGPEGSLYSCGLVLGQDAFRLGHILEAPLEKILNDPAISRAIPEDAPYVEHACDACPPLMAKRILGDMQ